MLALSLPVSAFIEERIIKLLSAFVNVKLALLLKEVMYIIWWVPQLPRDDMSLV